MSPLAQKLHQIMGAAVEALLPVTEAIIKAPPATQNRRERQMFDQLLEPERKPYHNWAGWPLPYCQDCGWQDVVEYCANNHPEGCNCVNPPCPPTREEIHDHQQKDRQQTSNPCGEVYKKEWHVNYWPRNFAAGGVVKSDVYGTIRAVYGSSSNSSYNCPPEFMPLIGTVCNGSQILSVDAQHDYLSARTHVKVAIQCPTHGMNQHLITTMDMASLSHKEDVIKAIQHSVYCPACRSPAKTP